MTSLTTIARPYARALLAISPSAQDRTRWSQLLEFLAAMLGNSGVKAFMQNLAIPASEKGSLLFDLAQGSINMQGQNLIKLLAKNKRLLIIPELFKLYEQMRKVADQEVAMKIISARHLAADELKDLQDMLAARITGHLALDQEVDPTLQGGAKFKLGDRVLDGSIHGRLEALHNQLTQ